MFYLCSRLTSLNSMDSDMDWNAVVGNVEKKWKVTTNTITVWNNVPCRVVGAEVGTLFWNDCNRPLDWEFTSFTGSRYGTWETKYLAHNKGLLHKLIWHRVCLCSSESGFMFIERHFGCRCQELILCDRDLQKGRRGSILPILLLILQDMFIRQEFKSSIWKHCHAVALFITLRITSNKSRHSVLISSFNTLLHITVYFVSCIGNVLEK
jgi:hypothetical protein